MPSKEAVAHMVDVERDTRTLCGLGIDWHGRSTGPGRFDGYRRRRLVGDNDDDRACLTCERARAIRRQAADARPEHDVIGT